jgi:hypothetical protein
LGPRSGVFWWILASIAAMLAGAFGPWAKVIGFVNVGGLDGDGWFVLGAAIVAAVMLFLHAVSPRAPGWPIVAVVVAGVFGSAVAVVDLTELLGKQTFDFAGEESDDIVDPGWGIWMSAIASASLAIAAAVRFVLTGRPR